MAARLLSILVPASICMGLLFAPSSTADDRGIRQKDATFASTGDRVAPVNQIDVPTMAIRIHTVPFDTEREIFHGDEPAR